MTRTRAAVRLERAAAICAALLLPLGAAPGISGNERQTAGENGHSGGCRARGVWYPEGAVIDLKTLTGVQSLSVTAVLFACENGVWVSVPAEK